MEIVQVLSFFLDGGERFVFFYKEVFRISDYRFQLVYYLGRMFTTILERNSYWNYLWKMYVFLLPGRHKEIPVVNFYTRTYFLFK